MTKPTNQLSKECAARSRIMHSRVLKALDKTGQANVAACVGVDPSTISRKKEKKPCGKSDLELMCDMLACCGLKTVPKDYQSYSKPHMDAIFLIAQNNLGRAQSVDDLFHDELIENETRLY